MREALPRSRRVRLTKEIRTLLSRGRRRKSRNVEVFCAPAPGTTSRFGLVVPKHGRRIVDRNLLKRRLREIGRRRLLPALDARGVRTDVLIRARRDAYAATFQDLSREVLEAVEALCSDAS